MTTLLLLRRFWPALAVVLLLGAVWMWGERRESAGYSRGTIEQAEKDRKKFEAAEKAATAAQQALIDATAANAAKISKRTEDALIQDRDAIARSYDDLRLRWAAYKGRAGRDASTGPAGSAAVPDDAYCAAQGWVSLDVAATAAQAADTAIAKDDAWRAWWQEQEAAWPR